MEMELALNLPADMTWISEPPPSLSQINNDELIFFEEYEFANELSAGEFVKPNQDIELEITAADVVAFEEILQLQEDLINETKSEPESSVSSMSDMISDQWMDQPINGPLNEYPTTHIQGVSSKTVQQLNEFNRVYSTFDSTHLTPPQTPPQTPPETLHSIHPNDSAENQFHYYPQSVENNICNYQFTQYIDQPLIDHDQNVSMPIQSNDSGFSLFEQAVNLVHESNVLYQNSVNVKSVQEADAKMLAEVDEFVRLQAVDYDDDCTSTSGASSYSMSMSSTSDAGSSQTDDSDWIPATPSSSIGAVGGALKAKQPIKRKPRSNRRTKEDRLLRKKEQNKNAANRYRMKKKAEIDILIDEERDLQKHNDSLMARYTDINREVKCLKSLLRELFREKGLI